MMNECPGLLFPETRACAGHGLGCMNYTTCFCEPGWTGRGDFIAGEPSCNLNVLAVQALWGMLACTHAIALPYDAFFILKKWRRNDFGKEGTTRMLVMGVAALIESAAGLILGLLKTTDPTNRTIGTDPFSTIMFSFMTFGMWTAAPAFLSLFVALNVKNLKFKSSKTAASSSKFIDSIDKTLPFVWGLCQIGSISPLIALMDVTNGTLMYTMAALHFLSCASAMAIAGTNVLLLLHPLLRDLALVISDRPDDKLAKVRQKFKRVHDECRNQMTVQCVAASIFGLWPAAQSYSSYELALAWIVVPLLLAVGLFALLPTKTEPTSSNLVDTLTSNGMSAGTKKLQNLVVVSQTGSAPSHSDTI